MLQLLADNTWNTGHAKSYQERYIPNKANWKRFFLEGFNTKMRLQGQSFKQEELQSKNKSVKNWFSLLKQFT